MERDEAEKIRLETQIKKMKDAGYSNVAIAEHLNVSEATVRRYLSAGKILWRVRRSENDPLQSGGLSAIILMASDREIAKIRAELFLRADRDQYEVTPLTEVGENITFLLNG